MERLWGRIRCLLGRHQRSRSRARRVGGGDRYVSVCRYCGVGMERIGKRRWVVSKAR